MGVLRVATWVSCLAACSGQSATPTSVDGGWAGPVVCSSDLTLPATAPALRVNEWVAINPPGFPFDKDTSSLGMAIHPCNPAVIYLCTGSFDTSIGGLYRSDDAGSTWARTGNVTPDWTKVDHLQAPLHVRIDPHDPQHVYVVQGVRGYNGFFVSTDGARNLALPQSYIDLNGPGMSAYDVYDIAVDPQDFKHLLLSFHSAWGWTDTKWNTNSGVLESKDGGDSWIVHEPQPGWGSGHAIAFLSDPELGIGDSNTWLLGTQGAGRWRTSDGGAHWAKVTDVGIQHGGGMIYYDHKNKALYATGTPTNQRSLDNGLTWEPIGAFGGSTGIIGDGERLYTAPVFGPSYIVAPEGDGLNWGPLTNQTFSAGPFDMSFDAHNRIVYASNWGAGLWAMKLP